jgi:diguanylate cyclase (GGDEF)-like protein
LDLGDAARAHALALRSCLSTPLLSNDQLVGVLSLYSPDQNGFNDDHRRIAEAVARQIANTFERAIEFDASSRRDEVTGLPSLSQLERVLVPKADGGGDGSSACALLVIEISSFTEINMTYGRPGGDEVLRHVARRSRAGLRVADILFRTSGNQFVAFLGDADTKTADSVADGIRSSIQNQAPIVNGAAIPIQVIVTPLWSPKGATSLRELLAVARNQVQERPRSPQSLIH